MTAEEQQLLDRVARLLPTVWSRMTSSDPNGWHPDNCAWGQCAVTALFIQDLFGGELRRSTTTTADGQPGPSHYFNLLPDGREVDLTRCQFDPGVTISPSEPRTRQQVLQQYPQTLMRYGWLTMMAAAKMVDPMW